MDLLAQILLIAIFFVAIITAVGIMLNIEADEKKDAKAKQDEIDELIEMDSMEDDDNDF